MTILLARSLCVRVFMLVSLLLSTASFSQTILDLGIVNVDGSPACASSANGTGHIICMVSVNGSLLAAAALVPVGAPENSNGPVISTQVPIKLNLGIGGTVGNSSCASTADSSGDVVCAVTKGGVLLGIRYNIFSGKIYPVQNLGLPAVEGNASCFNGNDRFTVMGPPPTEGPAGATICGVRSAGNIFRQVAFNPATGYLAVSAVNIHQQEFLRFDPMCVRAPDTTNEVICAWTSAGFNKGNHIQSGAIDPRVGFVSTPGFPSLPYTQVFIGTPGCGDPMDKSGMLLCIATDVTGAAFGFAMDPRTGAASAVLPLEPGAEAFYDLSPGCAGAGGGTNQIIRAITLGMSNELAAFQFDPRTGFSSIFLVSGGPTVSGSASCTFQNINPGQVSCGVTDSNNANELEIVVLL